MKVDTDKIAALAAEVAREELVELVDVDVGQAGPRTILRVTLDREGGIRIADCESFSRKMSALLDVEDPIPGAYSLEVSSPGVDRRLVRPGDFAASRGKRVRVALSDLSEGRRRFRGILAASDAEGIEVEEDGRRWRVPYRLIRRANLDVTQDELFGKGKKTR